MVACLKLSETKQEGMVLMMLSLWASQKDMAGHCYMSLRQDGLNQKYIFYVFSLGAGGVD